jgi:hypothetical protein
MSPERLSEAITALKGLIDTIHIDMMITCKHEPKLGDEALVNAIASMASGRLRADCEHCGKKIITDWILE